MKFAAIYTSNLDEFFMIRVAGLHDQVDAGIERLRAGLTPSQTIDRLRERIQPQMERQARLVDEVLFPALAENDIRVIALDDVPEAQRPALYERYKRQILPVLTPLAVGLGRPFPYISNLSLSLAVLVRDPQTDQTVFARVKVPKEMIPRFVPVVEGETTFVLLEDLIAANLPALFPEMQIVDHGLFRVTRDADFEISDEADDLLEAVEAELRRRPFGEAVRLEIEAGLSDEIRSELVEAMRVEARQVYEVPGMLDLNDLWQIAGLPGHTELRDEPWTPVTRPRLAEAETDEHDMFAVIRHGDLLVHHPYDSFATSVERFVQQAVEDPDVLAIKHTVYRTSDDSPLVPSLIRATERGKQAVCLVELKARFDERANIIWGRKLEEAGVHVVYGMPGLKTHAKCVLVVRREGDGVRRYVHIGTGNYHPKTARLYTDFGLFTCDDRIGADVADMFNFLTGYGRPARYREVLMAPNFMLDGILERIERSITARHEGRHAAIKLKMNALVHPRVHRGALPRLAGRRPGGAERARRLLPGPGHPGRLGQHPRHVRRRALPRALAHLCVRVRGRVRRADRLGGPDAAQPRQPRRADHARQRSRLQGRAARHARALPRGQHERVGAAPRRQLGARRARSRRRGAKRAARDAGARRRPGRRDAGAGVLVEKPQSLAEQVAAADVRAPTRGNRKLEQLLDAVNADDQIRGWWYGAGVNANRLGMSDHSWVHIQIVTNIALRLARLLFRGGVEPAMVTDHGMSRRDAEVVIAGGALLHCLGMSIHRQDHETYSLFLAADRLPKLLKRIYDEPERTVISSEIMHAIISHRSKGQPQTIEAAIVRVADALDMARGRARLPFEAGETNIHSLSAYAIEEVKILPGEDTAVRVEIAMSNSAGIFQVDEGLGTKLRGTPLEPHIEVVARIEAEHEERLVPVFRL